MLVLAPFLLVLIGLRAFNLQISIVGGELFNKGAQAMVFTVVNEVKMRYPDAHVTLLSGIDFNRPKEEKSRYQFDILPWDIRLKLRTLPLVKFFIQKKHFNKLEEQHALATFKSSDLIIDVSGYALSSVFSRVRLANYFFDLFLAKKHQKKIVYMPQSFGPLDFGALQVIINFIIKRLMTVPVKVYAREKAGFELMRQFIPSNQLSLNCDTVLQSNQLVIDNIFCNYQPTNLKIHAGSVAIIPNEKVFKHNKQTDLQRVYVSMVSYLLGMGKTVILIHHSFEDAKLCLQIKQQFEHESNVVLIDSELDAVALSSLIHRMDFIIASRYHAVVHAYKEHVPAVVIGWADKYVELMELFEQQDYNLDIRNKLSIDNINLLLDQLDSNKHLESAKIQQHLEQIQKKTIFDGIFQTYLAS